jgi:O-antigen/teichoic acid export membrane protein
MLLGGAVLAGAGSALYYLYQMLFKEKKLFTYCLVGAAINLAMVPPAWKEMRGSLGSVRQPGPEAVSPAG